MHVLLSTARRLSSRSHVMSSSVRVGSLHFPLRASNLRAAELRVTRRQTLLSTAFRSSSTAASSGSVISRLQRMAASALSKLQPPAVDSDTSEPKLKLSRLFALAAPERSLIGFALASQLVAASSIMVFPLALGNIVDAVTGTLPTNLNTLVAIMGGVFAISGVATATRVSAMSLAGSRISRTLRVNLYNAILKQDTAFFDVRQSGELVNRLSNDVPIVSRTLTEHLAKIIRSGVTATASLGLIIYLSPKLSLITLCSIPPIALFATIFGRSARHLSRSLVDALAAATQVAAERTSAVRTVRTFGAEALEKTRYADRVDETYGLAKRVALADGLYSGSVQLAAQMSLLGVLWFGGRMVLEAGNPMTIGSLTSFSMYAVNLGVAVAGIGTAYGQLTRALGSGYRIFEVLDRQPQGPSSTLNESEIVSDNSVDSERHSGSGTTLEEGYDATVRFNNVHFTYPTRPESPILRGVDLAIRPGEILAVAGMSGSGKSTLSALLSRLYEPLSGSITIAGAEISDLNTRWLRQQVAVVAQEPVLFSGSVAENIWYALDGEICEARVKRASVAAASRDMIEGLEHGFDTQVGERGSALSGGQRARIALCRALVRDPRVLVLDEHSAALDAESERAVSQAVETAASELNMAVLTIAHRVSSLQRADRVAVLVDGRVAETDTFESLMSNRRSHLYKMLAPGNVFDAKDADSIHAVGDSSDGTRDSNESERLSEENFHMAK